MRTMFARTAIPFFLCTAALAADVTGAWNLTATTASGREYKTQMVLTEAEGKLSGTVATGQGTVALEEVKMAGSELSYRIPLAGGVAVKLAVEGAAMQGTFSAPDGTTGKLAASRVPAGAKVAGHWSCEAKTASGQIHKILLDIAEEGGKLSGTATRADGSAPLEELKLEGDRLSFKIAADGTVYTVSLTVDGRTLKGSYSTATGATGSVTGTR